MKYYIIDDNIATAKNLENIIRTRNLGKVLGIATDPEDAIAEITEDLPDIVLVDFLMDKMDGVKLIEKVRQVTDYPHFVMISKVNDKEMIQNAYSAGIEFFINKPINIVEVESVLNNLTEKIRMQGVLNKMQSLISGAGPVSSIQKSEENEKREQKIDHLLGNLGMLGERGVQDIRLAYSYMSENNLEYGKEVQDYLEKETGDSAKNIEQRLRRAIKKGLTNAAAIAIDNIYSDLLSSYANYVFEFSAIKDEMNRLQGKNCIGGRVKVSRFMNGLIVYGDRE